jgi:hypothetical protein
MRRRVRRLARLRQPSETWLCVVELPHWRAWLVVVVEAAEPTGALALLPSFVADRTIAIEVREVEIP